MRRARDMPRVATMRGAQPQARATFDCAVVVHHERARAPRCGSRRPCDTGRVTPPSELTSELQATWHRDIPPAAAMAIQVAAYDGRTLTVRAPLAANRNLHGTAFAGSLFSVCVLTGW